MPGNSHALCNEWCNSLGVVFTSAGASLGSLLPNWRWVACIFSFLTKSEGPGDRNVSNNSDKFRTLH